MLQFDDPINIQFTSGTTGLPKGATLTHHNILNNGFFIGEAMHYTDQDAVCIPVPLYHCFGMVIGNLGLHDPRRRHGVSRARGSIRWPPCRPSPRSAAPRSTACRPCSSPNWTIRTSRKFDLTSLRTGMMAGAPCPIEVMRRCIRDMHLTEITIGYGMTETSPVSIQTRDRRSAGAAGRAPSAASHPHLEVKIVDAEGRIVPRGVAGEFCTRGYSVMLGYWDDPERTAEAIDRAGWMHTGDLATIDAEGYCDIVGRIKDMVIRGGENVYPREIEEFLYRHPGDRGRAGVRRAGRAFRRGTLRLDQAARRRDADRGGREGVLQGPDRPLQGAALHPLRRRVPDDRDRQDAEIPDACDDGG